MEAARMEMTKSKNIQEEIWTEAVAATRYRILMSTRASCCFRLNNMIDITTTRTMDYSASARIHSCACFRAWPHLLASAVIDVGAAIGVGSTSRALRS